jgi:D-alanyl-D-alanine carboxypeptidase
MFLILALALRWPRGAAATTSSQPSGRNPHTRLAGNDVRPSACSYADTRTRRAAYPDWQRTLVDTEFAVPATYRPPDVASIRDAGFTEPFLVRALVLRDLAALRRAASAAGHPLGVVAAYRSYEQQADLFARRETALGHEKALEVAARPGHSEHQLGTTVDFTSAGQTDVTKSWGATPDGRWLHSNAYRFGFIESYPEGRSSVTCYGYEPWHFRYFGKEIASRIHSSGLTVREYLWRLDAGRSKN